MDVYIGTSGNERFNDAKMAAFGSPAKRVVVIGMHIGASGE